MKIATFKEAQKLWSRFLKPTAVGDLAFSIDIHKNILEFFQVGDFYHFIFNVHDTCFERMSNEIFSVLGYEPQEVDVPFFLDKIIHPDDQAFFLNCEKKVTDFFGQIPPTQIQDYKVRYDYRLRKKDGNHIRILQQVVVIQLGEERDIQRTFVVHTDISHLKKTGKPSLSFIGMNGAPSYIDVDFECVFTPGGELITKREKQILSLLVDGKSTQEISDRLFISIQTVQTHRKNLLRKTNSCNVAQLTLTAIKNGWI